MPPRTKYKRRTAKKANSVIKRRKRKTARRRAPVTSDIGARLTKANWPRGWTAAGRAFAKGCTHDTMLVDFLTTMVTELQQRVTIKNKIGESLLTALNKANSNAKKRAHK